MRVWLDNLANSQPMVHALLALAFTSFFGLVIGSAKLKGLRLGTAGALFTGIVLAHFGVAVDARALEFARDAGLVLFVFMLGMQLGPGFFDSLRREGLRLNLVALSVVVLGSGGALVAFHLFELADAAAVGLLSGATTNTPSLAAAQQALASRGEGVAADAGSLAASAYAVAYPLGIVGIILSLVMLRLLFRIDVQAETAAFEARRHHAVPSLERRAILVQNPNLAGLAISELPHISSFGVRLSRHRPAGSVSVRPAGAATVLQLGDALLAVGTAKELDDFERLVGTRTDEDLASMPGDVSVGDFVVTRKKIVGLELEDLHLGRRFGVQVTRVIRSGVELAPDPELRVRLGDVLRLVGQESSLAAAGKELGNSLKSLDQTHFTAVFLGIGAGLLVGLAPLSVPGLPAPVRLGLAGGPLIVAILLSRAGRIGPIVCHMPSSAGSAMRDLGITLFLASVGLKAGAVFFEKVLSPVGLMWVGLAMGLAVLPPLLVGIVARRWLKLDFATLSGVIAGSTTDPPALAFATTICRTDQPSIAYASVYPLTMILRIVGAQALLLVMHASTG